MGRWLLGEEIGRGALGRVVRVEHPESGRVFAGKLLHDSHEGDAGAAARFEREAALVRGLVHENVVRIDGLEEIDGQRVLLMELVDGPSLAQLLATEGPLSETRLRTLARGIAAGLAAAHRAGVVHRDLKPANILVGAKDVPKLVDFGLARASSFAGVDRKSFALVGTPDYLAPESVDPLAVDARSDLYSLGCILYECATGEPPFRAPTAFALLAAHQKHPAPGLPSAFSRPFAELVSALLAKSPADRPQSAAAVIDAFDRQTAIVLSRPEGPARGCAKCGAAVLPEVGVCFACGQTQVVLATGGYSLFVVGPGKLTHKLDGRLRQKLLAWLEQNPQLGLDASRLAKEVPRLPFPLATELSLEAAAQLGLALQTLGLETATRKGGAWSLPDIRRKGWKLGVRIAAIAIASGVGGLTNIMRHFPLLFVMLGLLPLVSVAVGFGIAGKKYVLPSGKRPLQLPDVLAAALARVGDVVPTIEAARHREALRGIVTRALALRKTAGGELDAELARCLDLAVHATLRIDALERSLAAADLREADAAVHRDLHERDGWAARLLELAAQLDALRVRWVAAQPSGDEKLAELRAQVAALEEVQAL
jgi:hypothetical protein